jgi:HEAT repeat protein
MVVVGDALQVVRTFLHQWDAASDRGRQRLSQRVPVEAVQHGALHDPDPWVRRQCLAILDHHASDVSTDVFRAALDDPATPVREIALHGLACERCRSDAICLADVVPRVARVLDDDPSPEVRYKALGALVRFASRSAEAAEALARATVDDEDALVREAASLVVSGHHLPNRQRLRRRAQSRRGKASRRARPPEDAANPRRGAGQTEEIPGSVNR